MKQMPRVRRVAAFSISLLLIFSSLVNAGAQRRTPVVQLPTQRTNIAPGKRPRLVLLIVVDQFRYDYLERFNDLFVPNGFKRLMANGASWTQANYDHMPTYTAPGHATLMTGAWPAETGIVGNDWPDRGDDRFVTSVFDKDTILLGGEKDEETASPRRLMASTLGDELRLQTNDASKVIGISSKARSAILPAGRHANAAYWFSLRTGRMVSSPGEQVLWRALGAIASRIGISEACGR